MLDSLRRGASGWLAKIMMGLLVVSFAVWGIADVFSGYSTDEVAKVGKESITLPQFERELDSQMKQFSQRLGQPITRDQAKQYGLVSAALTRLIALSALDSGAHRMGLAVGDEAVAQNITSDPSLKGPFGKFDPQEFRQALAQAGVSESAFIADRRNFMVRQQINDVMGLGVGVPTALLDAFSTYQQETRVASYMILPPEAVGTIAEPDEKTLAAYHQKAAIHFTVPETRDFSLMVLEPKDLMSTIAISDADLQKTYEQRRAEFDVAEKRMVEQIPFATDDAAKAALELLRKGHPLDEILEGLGLDKSDVSLGLVTRAQMISPAVADAAFALKPNEYSEPVKGPLGPVILHVTEIQPGKVSTFEEAKDKLRKMLADEQARSAIYDVQNSIEDARAGGASLEEIAEKNHLKVVRFSGVSIKGLTLDGKKPEGLPEYKNLIETVFRSEAGDQIPPGDTGEGGYYWLRVDDVKPQQLEPLDKVRDKVVKLWKSEKRKADLEVMAQKLVERGDKGESFDKLAGELGRTVLISPEIKRYSQSDTFSRVAVTRLFAAPKGGFTYGPVGFGESLIIMQVKTINDPKPDPKSAEYKKLHDDMLDSLQTDMITTTVGDLEQRLGVKLNLALLQRVTSTDYNQ
ncbi:MAG TPA: SurA N-terminal domain-containing protein [Parvibaculum sp.]|uniref:SurA N-terminal domain-containing protein n=1 Tax=Parvibaculum sp. TaxID=2024848 RepID=UPI002B592C76|nr:SurA N-terminal domain-containing protein [Parvibaculum sp.]HMM14139.1 SurA N-terminal domain-containing protein [Parvibaculum sp.]